MNFNKTILALLFLAYISGCKPEKFTTNSADKLSFSYDTILFDTIISQLYIGTPKSVNRQFVIHNKHNKKIKTTIFLAGGNKSTFRLNVDGDPGTRFEEIEIRPHDSVFVFVEAYANPNHDPSGNALIIHDSIVFLTNGNFQNVQLVAWGQDANYIYKDSANTDVIWGDNSKPYVVYDFFKVKPGATLTIKPGVKIYFSPYSAIETYGTLKIEGTASEPVILEGDRTSDKNSDRHSAFKYANIPGQWFGLAFGWPTKGNIIKYARIKNATFGVFVDSSSSDGKATVSIYNSFIQNITANGVIGKRANIYIENSVLANCGSACLYTYKGGDYDLRHVTVSGYCDFGGGNDPALAVTNRLRNSFGQVIETFPNLNFRFYNSIVYGELEEELGFDIDPNKNPLLGLSGSLLKTKNLSIGTIDTTTVITSKFKFKDHLKYRFDLDTLSEAKDIGLILSPPIPKDYGDKLRDSKPDAGAFERIE